MKNYIIFFAMFFGFFVYGQEFKKLDSVFYKKDTIIKGLVSLKGWYNFGIGSGGTLNVLVGYTQQNIDTLYINAVLGPKKNNSKFALIDIVNSKTKISLGENIDRLLHIEFNKEFRTRGLIFLKIFKAKKVEKDTIYLKYISEKKGFSAYIDSHYKKEIDKLTINLSGSIFRPHKIKISEYFIKHKDSL